MKKIHLGKDADVTGLPFWVGWAVKRGRVLAVIFALIGGSSAAWAAVTSWSLVGLSQDFREIARIAIGGNSLPALHARRAVYKELLEEEQNKRSPNLARLQEMKQRILAIDYRLLFMRRLEQRYKAR